MDPERGDIERAMEERVYTTDDILDVDDIRTTEDIEGTEDVLTPQSVERDDRTRRSRGIEEPDEDQEVNPIGSYESWDLSGQSLDAAGSGMTGDSGAEGLTGTGFEDDTEVE